MKISALFLCPEYPYPATSGGKVAHVNHIEAIKKNYSFVKCVFFDVDGNITDDQISSHEAIFKRAVLPIKTIRGKINYASGLFLNSLPRVFAIKRTKKLLNYVDKELESGKYDVAVFDHLTSFAFLKKIKKKEGIAYVYIAHNVEKTIAKQQYLLAKNVLEKLVLYIEYKKINYFENKCISLSDTIVTISSHDQKELMSLFCNKIIINIPELIPLKSECWQYNGSKNIVFIGATSYYPNYDAVNWLLHDLMPSILLKDSSVKCFIIGDCTNYPNIGRYSSDSVCFTGRVTDEELKEICLSSSIFISPVIYGSGIKIKILEAASMAMPVLSTPQSLLGNDFMNDEIFKFNRNDLQSTTNKILEILNSRLQQEQMSHFINNALKKAYNENDDCWKQVVSM